MRPARSSRSRRCRRSGCSSTATCWPSASRAATDPPRSTWRAATDATRDYSPSSGFAVDAVDVSNVAIEALRAAAAERGLRIDARVLDLEHDALPARAYDVVVCLHYLQRDIFGALAAALRPGGLLLVETFARAHLEELGRDFNPAYVLERNELLRAVGGLYVRHYREGVAELRGGERGVAGIVAQRLA